MKLTKEITLKIELSGKDLEFFKGSMEKVLKSEKDLGLKILDKKQVELFQEILNVLQDDKRF